MKKNQNSNNMSFIDETSNVTKKAKVKKRNKELKIKQSRLRKPLQNDNLLKNYFEFDKQQLTESDLTIYKIINPPNASTTIIDNSNTSSSIENNTTCPIETSTVDTIITCQKVKCKTMNNTNNLNQHASSNIEYSSSSLTINSINSSSGGSSTSGSSSSACSDNTSKEEEEEAVEFDDCESFLSSISFLFN
ncbi:predicted protein [Naegleria gruberi]|uniref:Predicted protein n=1 Tax=Naegleria gruberi TaxID=5762 RepID=D2W5C7_NAEGR|nr:uncharacterized protein NAEGRDRAFT_54780 [Naegleria gruberi]EFC35724.1 predicted protein [Naegleria gruberi]|eukprot:XP_002668468.1 predicted protein [Naegleria gruberi strain NEG-M]